MPNLSKIAPKYELSSSYPRPSRTSDQAYIPPASWRSHSPTLSSIKAKPYRFPNAGYMYGVQIMLTTVRPPRRPRIGRLGRFRPRPPPPPLPPSPPPRRRRSRPPEARAARRDGGGVASPAPAFPLVADADAHGGRRGSSPGCAPSPPGRPDPGPQWPDPATAPADLPSGWSWRSGVRGCGEDRRGRRAEKACA